MSFPFNVYLLALVGAGAASAASMPLWRTWCRRFGIMDDPGHRKIHVTPTPLAGGLAVMTGLFLPLFAGAVAALVRPGWSRMLVGIGTTRLFEHGFDKEALQLAGIIFGAFSMLIVGLCDDKYELRPAIKFSLQLAIALTVAACGVRISLFVPNIIFHYAITALWILTVVNAFNFMDNMNGLCAGLGLIGAWGFGVFAAISGQYLVATTAFLVAGALAGFLPFNFPAATAFLGDAGSHLVGYLLAVLAILPHFYSKKRPEHFAVLTPLFVLAVPLADMAWVVLLRWRLGKPFYIGDTNHLSHRLVRKNLTRTQAVLVIWLLAAALCALGFVWE